MELKKKNVLGLEVVEVPGDPEGVHVLLFHGFGADAYDLVPLSQVFKKPPKPTWYFPTAPLKVRITSEYEGRAWFPIDIPKLQAAVQQGTLEALIQTFPSELFLEARRLGEQLIAELNIPLSKLFLGGFSQGALLATDLAFHALEQPAGLLIFSSILTNEADWKKCAPLCAGMPFFQSHGTNDPIFPIKWAKALEAFLVTSGLKGHLHSFSGGHEIPQSILIELRDFFTKFVK